MNTSTSSAVAPIDPSTLPVADPWGLDENVPVRCVNLGAEPVTWTWARQKFLLHPGVQTYVPFQAMCMHMGDPRVTDIDEIRRDRTDTYKRLRVFWGAYEHDDIWEQNRPRILVMPIDRDERVITVVDDPEGAHLTPASESVAQHELMANTIQHLSNQLRQMEAQMAALQPPADPAAANTPSMGAADPAFLDSASERTETPAVTPQPVPGAGESTTPKPKGVKRDGE